jgi:hypothetical protein
VNEITDGHSKELHPLGQGNAILKRSKIRQNRKQKRMSLRQDLKNLHIRVSKIIIDEDLNFECGV